MSNWKQQRLQYFEIKVVKSNKYYPNIMDFSRYIMDLLKTN